MIATNRSNALHGVAILLGGIALATLSVYPAHAQAYNVNGGSGNGIAIGGGAATGTVSSVAQYGLAIGINASTVNNARTSGSPVAIGTEAKATGLGAPVAIGDTSIASGFNSISIGGNANSAANVASGDYSAVLGSGWQATGISSFALGGGPGLGGGAKSLANFGLAIGSGATINSGAIGGVALGQNAVVSYANGVAIGTGSLTSAAPAGAGFLTGQAAPAAAASFDSASIKRRLSNLADGSAASDAVTVAQLSAEDDARNALGASVATNLGGGALYNATTGVVGAPSYAVQGGTFTNVGAALGALNTGVNTNTTAIAGNTTAITTLGGRVANGGTGPVQYSNTATATTPNGGTKSQNLTLVGAAAGAVGLHNVAVGAVTATSTDAVNGSQLAATNTGLVNTALALGSGASFNPTTGVFTAPTYVVQGGTFANVGAALGKLDTAITTNTAGIAANVTAIAGNTTSITTLANGLGNGSIGLVQQTGGAPGAGTITVGAATAGTKVNFAGTAGTRTLAGVTAGVAATDAVNVGQLNTAIAGSAASAVQYDNAGKTAVTLGGVGAATPVALNNVAAGSTAAGSTAAINGGQLNVGLASVAATIGGGSTYNPTTGQVTAPAYTVQGGTFTNVGAALGALNTGVNANTTVIAGNTTAITALGNLLANGGAGPVQYANAATPTTPNGGTKSQDLTLVGAAPGAVGLHNVAVGAVNAASTDAIDGSQLYATNQGVAGNTAALGGGAGFNPQTGAYTPPSYAVQGQTYSNVGAAVNALNGGVTAANGAAAAAGTTATTALALARNSVQYDASGPTNVTFNPGGAAASLHNVSAGLAANDAVNVGQLAAAQLQTLGQANAYTNAGLARIDFDLRAVDRRAQSSAAATSALSGIPQVITPGMGLVGGAIGGQGDYVAIAIGASKAFNDGHTIAKAAISYIGTTNQVGYHVGVGYQF